MKPQLKAVLLVTLSILAISGCAAQPTTPTPTNSETSVVNQAARAALPAAIRKAGVLQVASDATYAPNEFTDNSNVAIGWEIELVQAAAQQLGLRVKVTNLAFADILPQIQAGQVDIGVSSFFDTPARRQLADMVDYYRAGTQWAMLKTSNVAPDNACGLVIAVQKDTYQSDIDLPAKSLKCKQNGRKPISILALRTQDQATEAVLLNQASAFVADLPVTAFAVMKSSGRLVYAGDPYDTSYYGMPVRQGSSLGHAMQLAIQGLMDRDAYREILNSWGVQDGAIGRALINGAN